MLRGLPNQGNTCFLNSALQVLATLPTLQNTRTLGPFFKGMVSGKQMNPLGPRALVMRSFVEFRNGRQHDSHEWMLRLLEVLEKDDEALITADFDGKFDVSVCFPDCGHISRHDEVFRTLSLNLPQKGGMLQEALGGFGEAVRVFSTCDDCEKKERKPAIKSMRISKFPRYLIIHWMRFEKSGMKSGQRIPCPARLDNYELSGIVNHAGRTANSGHYTACVKHGRQWYLANDSSTMKIEERHALKAAEAGYILVYRLAGADKDAAAKDKKGGGIA
jgi:ubiquitin C-terminal hydrolase